MKEMERGRQGWTEAGGHRRMGGLREEDDGWKDVKRSKEGKGGQGGRDH